jgi:hypothetical protein
MLRSGVPNAVSSPTTNAEVRSDQPQLSPVEASEGRSSKPPFIVPICCDLLRVSSRMAGCPPTHPSEAAPLAPRQLHPQFVPTILLGEGMR